MILIVSGLVFLVIGFANLATGRLHPERANASLSRGLGYVGIACGAITLLVGILQVAGLYFPPVPPAQPGVGRQPF